MTIKHWFEDVGRTFGRLGCRSRWLPLTAVALAAALAAGLAAPRALAQAADVELPGVSVKTTESGEAEIKAPGVSIKVTPPEVHSTVEGEAIDLSGVWKFKGDWLESGLAEGWYKPDFDDSEWRSLHVPGSWESQGINTNNPRWPVKTDSCGYNGFAWYRTRFTVPESWADGRVLLRIGRIWDEDWTYVNGQPVGQMTGGDVWDQQRQYLIPPDVLKPGEDNVLAIRVFDSVREGGIAQGPVELVNVSAEGAAGVLPPETRDYQRTRGDIVRVGSSVTIDADEKVLGNVVAIGGDVDVYGYVTGDTVAVGGSVRARDGCRIDGDLGAVGGSVHREPGAAIGGEIMETQIGIDLPWGWLQRDGAGRWRHRWEPAVTALGLFGGLLAWGFIALLSVLLFRERLEVMAGALAVYPGRAVLYGLAGFALTPAALVAMALVVAFVSALLFITLVGIPLIPAAWAAFLAVIVGAFVLLLAGGVAVWLSIGRAVATSLKKPALHPIWAVLIGLLLVGIATQLPVFGPLVVVTLIVFGFGLAIMTGFGTGPEWAHRRLGFRSSRPPSATPPTPAPGSPGPAGPILPGGAEQAEPAPEEGQDAISEPEDKEHPADQPAEPEDASEPVEDAAGKGEEKQHES